MADFALSQITADQVVADLSAERLGFWDQDTAHAAVLRRLRSLYGGGLVQRDVMTAGGLVDFVVDDAVAIVVMFYADDVIRGKVMRLAREPSLTGIVIVTKTPAAVASELYGKACRVFNAAQIWR